MSVIDDYIMQANEALRSKDPSRINAVAREIVSAFSTEIPHLSGYRGSAGLDGPRNYSESDLRKLIGKLRVLQESKDDDKYGALGLSALTDSIRQLEASISMYYSEEQYRALFNKIDHIYANKYHAYTDGLCGYLFNDDKPDAHQAQLRLEKLRIIRDEEMRTLRMAEAQTTQIALSQNQEATATASSIAVANLVQACDRIDEILPDKLSEDDKEYLKGLLASLEQSKGKKGGDKDSKLNRILGFLADKGTDVFIAVFPFIWSAIQSM